ncbi:IucA/IucC family siderophore biosynthesis protein [Thermomonospora sp. CIF 1]|uniref:IucA/IucC family protein n=1 Tax=Thermomonospora sp. CIF 1 TaxID=1916083 RepID=UPI000B2764D5|nr:IucA/IucC family protein [Thermomonospora sp. CIF 1]PKK12342.1 MAG: IucA/IucC family protein [Thermomonospora sp. CIF 1]
MLPTGSADRVLSADDATATALFNCLVREVCAPDHQVWPRGGHLLIRLPRLDVLLRARLARPPLGFTYRLTAPYQELRAGSGEWAAVDWRRLAELVAGELELATGQANPEFVEQVTASHTALAALLAARGPAAPPPPRRPAEDRDGVRPFARGSRPALTEDDRCAVYLASEQSLVAGHRFHPSPKARQGKPEEWLPYAPEAGARFPLRWLAVREEVFAEGGDAAGFAALEALAPPPPPGHRLLPAHPWQLSLLAGRPVLRRALESGLLVDLGQGGPEAVPTSSVRTLYVPAADVFCKFSLDMRITNCVRKNSWYELTGAVTLDRLLRPVFAELGERFGGCRLLPEPAYRSVHLADRRLHEGLGVILRGGVRALAGTPLVAAVLADPYGTGPVSVATLPCTADPDGALAWWARYVALVAPPALDAYLTHGVVLEPHLQNVVVAVDETGMPTQAAFRDLEGTKLVAGRWDAALAGLPGRVREALTYSAEQGWNRVVYCLLVNHLAEIAAAVADRHPRLEAELWRVLRECVADYARGRPGDARLRALLAGVPLPAKANLRVRWSRSADRAAGYIPVPNPLGTAPHDRAAPPRTPADAELIRRR